MARVTLFYDADCGFCQASVDWLVRRAPAGTFHPVAYQGEEEMRRYPMVDRTLVDKGIQALGEDGRLWRKSSATAFCLQQVPGWGWLGRLILCPVVHPFAALGYFFVAKNRRILSRLMGRSACRVRGSGLE